MAHIAILSGDSGRPLPPPSPGPVTWLRNDPGATIPAVAAAVVLVSSADGGETRSTTAGAWLPSLIKHHPADDLVIGRRENSVNYSEDDNEDDVHDFQRRYDLIQFDITMESGSRRGTTWPVPLPA